MGDLAAAERGDLSALAAVLGQDDPGADLLTEFLVRHKDLHLAHGGVAEQVVLTRPGDEAFAAAHDHVLDPLGDVAVALGVDDGEIAGMHPVIGVDRLGR